MKYFPTEILHKTFDKKMLGYDIDQVSDFLTLIAAQMESITQERNALKDILKEKELNLLEYKERDEVFKQTMNQSNQMTSKIRQDAEREAKLIINNAHQKSEIITRDAQESLKKIYTEIAELKKSKMQFEANMKALVQAHLSIIEQSDRYMPRTSLPEFDIG